MMVLEGTVPLEPVIKLSPRKSDDLRDSIFNHFSELFGYESSWCKVVRVNNDQHLFQQNSELVTDLFISPIKPNDLIPEFLAIRDQIEKDNPDWYYQFINRQSKSLGKDIKRLRLIPASTLVMDFLTDLMIFDSLAEIRDLVTAGKIFINSHKVHTEHLSLKMNDVSHSHDLYDLNNKKSIPIEVDDIVYTLHFSV